MHVWNHGLNFNSLNSGGPEFKILKVSVSYFLELVILPHVLKPFCHEVILTV